MPLDAIETTFTKVDLLSNLNCRFVRLSMLIAAIFVAGVYKYNSLSPFVGFDGLCAVLGIWLLIEVCVGTLAYNEGQRGAEFWFD